VPQQLSGLRHALHIGSALCPKIAELKANEVDSKFRRLCLGAIARKLNLASEIT
jgi:hypothetical protein